MHHQPLIREFFYTRLKWNRYSMERNDIAYTGIEVGKTIEKEKNHFI